MKHVQHISDAKHRDAMLLKRPRPKILFDANAIRYFFGRDGFADTDLVRVRERVLQRAARDDIRVVITTPVLWELTKFYGLEDFGPARYLEMIRFVATAASRWALRNEHERIRLELLRRRRLRDAEAFDGCDVNVTLSLHSNAADLKRIYEMQRDLKTEERLAEPQKRQALVDALDGSSPTWRQDMQAELDGAWRRTVGGLVKVEMRKHAKQYGMRLIGSQWPKPLDVPTLWYSESLYAAKFRRVFVDSRKLLTSKTSIADAPDMFDVTHFRDAAYVDLMVTQDEVFAEVATAARVPLAVMTFDDFARDVLTRG